MLTYKNKKQYLKTSYDELKRKKPFLLIISILAWEKSENRGF